MPLADGSGGRKPPVKKSPIVVYNPATNHTAVVAAPTSSTNLGAPKTSGPKNRTNPTGATSGSGGSASSSTSSTTASYQAEQRKRDMAARDRYIEDAENMGGQVDALRRALGLNSRDGRLNGTFRKALRDRIDNIMLVRDEQLDVVRDGFEDRKASLDADEANNRTAASDSSVMNETNRGRERASAISEAMAQGAGESDTLRVQLHSLRNWDANQDGINRAFADGQRSINNSRIDLDTDTRTGMANIYSEANADKQAMWDNYYNQTSEAQTQLGNVLGQQAEYYGLAIEAAGNAGNKNPSLTIKSSSSSSSNSKSKGKTLGVKGKTAQAVGSTRGDFIEPDEQPLLQQTRPDGRPVASDEKLTRNWDKPNKLGNRAGGGRPKRQRNLGSLRERQDTAASASDAAFMGATKATRKVWQNPGQPDEIANWDPIEQSTDRLANSIYTGASNMAPLKAPEGATLRKW